MRWTQSEPLRGRSRRSWAFDVAVALFALIVSTPYVLAADEPRAVGWTIVIALAAPLLVRRIWPLPAYVASYSVAAVSGWWAEQLVWSIALLVGLYTVAARCTRRTALSCAALLALGCVVWARRVYPGNLGWQSVSVALLVTVVATTVLGLYIATRRTLLLELQDRAARLELERDQQAEIAAAAERARIARELHDIVAHHLTVMVALADGAAAQSSRSPDRAGEAMRTVSATGRQALTDTRRLLGVLREQDASEPVRSPLPDLGDLDDLVAGVRAAGLPVRYEHEGRRPDLDAGTQLALFRLVQEALTNVMKHAGPDVTATVRVAYRDDEVTVDVVDDGRGNPETATAGSGRGLPGMRERMAVAGGEVVSGPATGRGWAVRARLPLAPADPAVVS